MYLRGDVAHIVYLVLNSEESVCVNAINLSIKQVILSTLYI